MKTHFLSLILLVHCAAAEGISVDSLSQKNTIPLDARLLFAQLAQGDLAEQDEGINTLTQVPGIAPVLVELLQRIYNGSGDYLHLLAVMRVLERRTDLADKQLDFFRQELRAKWNKKDDARSAVLKERGLRVLANYSGKTNEDVLLLYLTEPQTIEVIGFSRDAAEGLAKIGTARSQSALEAYLKQHPVGSTRHDAAQAAISAMARRSQQANLRSSNPGVSPDISSLPPTSSKPLSSSGNELVHRDQANYGVVWWLLALALAVAGVTFALCRRSSR